MGTRADFYVGLGRDAEWLGSIAWDGYPSGVDDALLAAKTEQEYRERAATFFAKREDYTAPEVGWPWPWNDSNTTDYAYAFADGQVHVAGFGHGWSTVEEGANISAWDGEGDEPKPTGPLCTFPDMTARKNVTFGKRSGVMIIGI